MNYINIGFTLIICLFSSLLFSQDDCDRLFYEFNPQYISGRTTSLVINQITENCIDDPFNLNKDEKKVRKSNQNQTVLNLNKDASLANAYNFVYARENMLDLNQGLNEVQQYVITKESQRLRSIKNAKNQKEALQNVTKFFPLAGASGGAAIGSAAGGVGALPGAGIGYGVGGAVEYGANRYGDFVEWAQNTNTNRNYDIAEKQANVVRAKLQMRDFDNCVQTNGISGFADCFTKKSNVPVVGRSEPQVQSPYRQMTESAAQEMRQVIFEEDPSVANNNLDGNTIEELKVLQKQQDNQIADLKTQYESDRNSLLSSVNEFSKQLETYGNDLIDYQEQVSEKLSDLQTNTDAISGSVLENRVILKENRDLIAQNGQSIAATQDMIYATANPQQRLLFKQNCINGEGVCPPGVALERLNDPTFDSKVQKEVAAIEVQQFIQDAQTYVAIAQSGLDVAVALGLSDQDAKNVGDGLFYVGSLLSIGAAIMSPSPQSIMAGLQGLVGLIGGPSEPVPSPELQAIMQMREEMHERFDRVEDILSLVLENQAKIAEQLQENIEINRSIMQYEFADIEFTLENIVNRQNIITSQLRTLLDNEFNNCREIYETTIQGSPVLSELSTYQNYIDIFNSNPSSCNQCVQALRNRLNSSVNGLIDESGLPALDFFDIDFGDTDEIDREHLTYRKLASFYEWYYGDQLQNLDRATDLLFLPSDLVSESYQIYCELRNDTLLNFNLDAANILHQTHYLDPYAFREFIELYSVFYPFLEIQDFESSDNYRPRDFEDLVDFSNDVPPQGGTNQKENRLRSIESDMVALTQVQEIILAQQSLMSGTNLIRPFYMILYQNQYNGSTIEFNGEFIPVKQFVTDILSNSPIIAQNFAVFVLRKNYRFNEYIYKDSTAWIAGMARNESARSLLTYGYDGLPIYSHFPQDSFEIHNDSLSTVDISKLESSSYVDVLNFHTEQYTADYTMTFLDINVNSDVGSSCQNNGANFTCRALIPFPESIYLFTDKYTFVGAHQYALESQAYIDHLNSEVNFGRNFSHDWQEGLTVKYSFIKP